jgi:biopolymer transport protein ExbD
MKFGRNTTYQDEGDPVPLAPLIDIVFLTLVFFMVTSIYSTLEAEVDITLPTANSAVLDDRAQGEIFINLRADGSIILNERTVTVEELHDVLGRVAEYFPGGSVIIRGDRDADLGKAIAILDVCRQVDIQHVSFAALSPEE